VGGPALANSAPIDPDFGLGLMQAIVQRGTPIDFFSWHRYGWPWAQNGTGYAAIARGMRAALTAAGLPASLPMHLTEWNIGVLTNVADMALAATFVADVLASMLAEGVALSIFYPGCQEGWGLWEEGTPPVWRPMAHAHLAVGSTIRDYPASLLGSSAAAYPGGNPTIVAGAASNGSFPGGDISIVVSADGTSEGAEDLSAAAAPAFSLANLTVTGLAPGSTWNYTLRLINGTTVGPNATAWACNYCVVQEGTAQVPSGAAGEKKEQEAGDEAGVGLGLGGSLSILQAATPPVVLHLTLHRQQ
jgi:hypothetical protein